MTTKLATLRIRMTFDEVGALSDEAKRRTEASRKRGGKRVTMADLVRAGLRRIKVLP